MIGKKCDDCDTIIFILKDIEEGEIVVCSTCGLEYEYRQGELYQLTIDAIDWGE